MKIVFFGNPKFAIPSLKKIIDADFSILSVVSDPPKPRGRGKNKSLTAVGEFAKSQGIPQLFPTQLDDPECISKLKHLDPDYFIIVAYKILPEIYLTIPKFGSINLHGSLLPKYRGAAPIQRAIMNGEKITGLTTFFIRKKVDTGSILLQKSIPIENKDNFGSLSTKMADFGGELILKTINNLEKKTISPKEQKNSLATLAPKIGVKDCEIDWKQSAEQIHNQIRGLSPTPGAFTYVNGKRLRILESKIIASENGIKPGMVAYRDKNNLRIQTSSGLIELLLIQKAGKKLMKIKEFLNGNNLKTGDCIG